MKLKLQFITIGLFFATSFSAFAQTQLGRINVGVEVAAPVGNFSNISNAGFGISAKYEDAITTVKNLNWTAGIGFFGFNGKDNVVGKNVSFSIVPITGGIKYYAVDRFAGFYGSAELGLAVLANHYNNGFNNNYTYETGTYFTFAPGVGYQYNNFDFSARFQLVNSGTFFALRAAYVFKLSN